jgi:cytochrome c oxidase subunit 2
MRTFLIWALAASVAAAAPPPQAAPAETVVHVFAQRFEFSPARITLVKGVPVVLELETKDRKHGFSVTGLNIRTDIKPGEVTRVRVLPEAVGTFPFRCDVFCGSGHEDMAGEIVVVEN